MLINNISTVNIQSHIPDSAVDVLSDAAPRHDEPEQKAEPEVRISRALLNEVLHEIQMMRNVGLRFSVHEATGRTIVNVVEKETGKLIRQIPPEELLNLADRIGEMIGVLFDKKV